MSGYLNPWYFSVSSSPTWTELSGAPNTNWQDFDIVNDRTKMIGFAYDPYVSTNSGVTWTGKVTTGQTYTQDIKTRCKVSTNGTYYHLFGRHSVNSGLYVYCSINSGSTFTLGNSQNSLYSGAFDTQSNGNNWAFYISQSTANSGIYRLYSTPATNVINNGGENRAAAQALAISSDGSRVIAAGNGVIRVSNSMGTSFTDYTNSYSVLDVASNDAGDQAIASLSGTAYIKESTDYGASWSDNTAAGSRAFKGVCISNNGSIRLAWTVDLILRSTDSGATWTDITFPGASSIVRCGLSDDGLTVISANNPGYPRIINF